jgi:hypothetical protein
MFFCWITEATVAESARRAESPVCDDRTKKPSGSRFTQPCVSVNYEAARQAAFLQPRHATLILCSCELYGESYWSSSCCA